MTTREEAIRLASICHIHIYKNGDFAGSGIDQLERLIQLVRDGEAERLRQAKNEAYLVQRKCVESRRNLEKHS